MQSAEIQMKLGEIRVDAAESILQLLLAATASAENHRLGGSLGHLAVPSAEIIARLAEGLGALTRDAS